MANARNTSANTSALPSQSELAKMERELGDTPIWAAFKPADALRAVHSGNARIAGRDDFRLILRDGTEIRIVSGKNDYGIPARLRTAHEIADLLVAVVSAKPETKRERAARNVKSANPAVAAVAAHTLATTSDDSETTSES